ncbi:DSBA-like thioredoxin domain-containing protein [Pseudomassariella vexata]|uniref:DSBA-like thioredoxin domain-containing protein n=1 Tax=Pseudomassariella vexata TaxID=1141098 RepID=A0A1Y2DHI6_9PEZI|nr:DSBA-like thioredoxin domain-containing protein [Pseudomassariella vexata]ORY58711.1 DSBA-like thioredoxin domain-containing protein [Pseudomassariella vexata]
MTNFNIKIISDTVCPWCYVGKKKLDKAIELYRKVYPGGKDDTFTISWYPFYLDPTSPKVGIPVNERMAQRFGADRLPAMQARLKSIGEQEGINFRNAGKIGNTRDSHRLIQLGKTKGNEMENRVVLELFKSYFEGTGDITSHAMLIEAAEKAGLDKQETKTWLEEGKGGEQVDAEVQEAYRRDIHGVPHFTIQDKYEVDGAQDPDAFIEAFASVRKGK